MKRHPRLCSALLLSVLTFSGSVAAQSSLPNHPDEPQVTNPHRPEPTVKYDIKSGIKGVVTDQKTIWTSPLHLKLSDAKWLLPEAGVAAVLFANDSSISRSLTTQQYKGASETFSNVGIAALGATAGSLYVLGVRDTNPRMRESGVLSAEAGVDALVVDEVLKLSLRRERPNVNNAQGDFFFASGDSSFPSSHATTAFAVATVLANEYPSPRTAVLAYGLATAVSFSRVTAQEHFPSDVFVGATLGYLIGRTVYRHHHETVPTVNYGTFMSTKPKWKTALMLR